MRNYFFLFLMIFLGVFLINISLVAAVTPEELLAEILRIQAQIAELKKRLVEVQLKSEFWCHDFLTDLKYQQEGKNVKALQIALGKEGLFKIPATSYFGPITFQAVKIFQEKYQKEILAPSGFKKGTGFLGPTTRTKLNELYGCTKVSISSLTPLQGDALVIKIKTDLPIEKVKGNLNSKKINFVKIGEDLIGIFGISVKEKPGKYNLIIDLPEGPFLKKEINIIKRKFPVTELLITKELREKGLTISKIEEEVAKENLKMAQVLQIFSPPYFNQPFIYPLLNIKDVGPFGNIRKSGKITLQHLGVDLEAEIGNPVFAINDGIVRFSQELTNYGKTIIIDHGLGIFSLYLHLDEFKVSEGKEVKRGDIIALSGNSGYSIEPYLHFSIKINGESIDPLRFIEVIKKEME